MSKPVAELRGAENLPETVMVSDRAIAMEHRQGRPPGLFWLSGFRSDMTGSKATAVDAFAESHGLAVARFDYSGHGRSGGDFTQGTISRWLEEAEAVFATTRGPQIVIGSSMGGWLALLLNRARRLKGDDRIHGLVLIAPAIDMTQLMLEQMPKKTRKLLDKQGYVDVPSEYSAEPYRINKALIEDGKQHLMFGRAIATGCPVTILQGARDKDVPKEHAARLVQHLIGDPVIFTVVPDGDHRLSRPDDLALLERAIEQMIAERGI
jgi:pimeloyl-ACP methyl ester carboxylesterase